MMKVFAIPGESPQQIGGECPEGWVVMATERPENDMVASVDGEWVYPEPVTPTTCTPVQGLIALYAIKEITEQDILDKIALIEDQVDRYTMTVSYQKATSWDRESNTVQVMKQLLSLSEIDLDALFTYAVTVKA